MKVIPVNNITAVGSSAEDSEYIDDWVIENKIEKYWKSTSTSGTLTLTASSGNVIGLYNHNADTVTITIKNLAEDTTLDGPFIHDLSSYTYGNDCLWQEYDIQSSSHKVIVDYADGRADPVQCAINWVGEYFEFFNPLLALQFSYIPHHIKYKMSSRSIKYTEKALKKIFTYNTIEEDNNWWALIKYLKNYIGFKSVPWLLLDDNPRTHNLFGYLNNFDMGQYNYPFTYNTTFEIIEL